MYVPPTPPIEEENIEKVTDNKPGVYMSIDQIMRSVCKKKSSESSPMAGVLSGGN